ncbi:MAG TPA: 30S ribosomal protein S5 [Caldisericia bacterium]|nr:30S ribosomal protein S5 [Caldisericia bacterium]HPF49297.1 30S ribosomal protein S5 [Caldisericia bacterium]HPI84023.1 30S ribosomal protein S5 [Caldisericia bacterium]HPQ93281.1 30S ribosomal protein S5 [Caldisericia bacterium]HRV75337.1 30S ribosomal protein S5 [Caldisericia bacterium]
MAEFRRKMTREEEDPFEEQIVKIDRVSKTVKGGKRMRFRVLVVVGHKEDKSVGIGLGKAKEIPVAIRKAVTRAKRDMVKVPIRGTTVPHDALAKTGGVKVFLSPAVPGTGIIAGGAVRMVLEKAGLHDVITKAHGSTNAMNLAKTTIKALKMLKDPVDYAKTRGITLAQLFGR